MMLGSATRRPLSSSRPGAGGVRGPRRAEGVDSALVSDHFLPWRNLGGTPPFGRAGCRGRRRTSRIMLGTSVRTTTFRYKPAVLAQTFATSMLYPGRVAAPVSATGRR